MPSISSVLPSFISSNGVNFAQSKPGKSEFGTVVTGIGNKPISQAKAPEIVIASGFSHYACSAKSSARPSVVSLGSIAKRLGMLLLLAPSVFGQSCGPTSSGFDAQKKQCTGDTFIGDDCKGLNNATRDLFSLRMLVDGLKSSKLIQKRQTVKMINIKKMGGCFRFV